MTHFFLCLSLAFFITGLCYAIHMKRDNNTPWPSFLLILLITTAISMWLSVLPFVQEGAILYKGLFSAFYVMESAVGNVDYSLFSQSLGKISFWRIYTILLHLLMPVTTYSVILVYFFKAFGWFRYTLFRGNKEIILFSDFSEKSKAYAKRVKSKDKLMIFCNTENGEKEIIDDEISRNMIFTEQSEIEILRQIDKKNLIIMEMNEDENRNVQKSVEIIQYLSQNNIIKDGGEKPINIYTTAYSPIAATILDNAMGRGSKEKKTFSFHQTVINEYKRIAFHLLYANPLYKNLDEKTKQLDILIVGFGRMGQEILKAISWTGCFPNTNTNVHVISRHAVKNGNRLLSECPELGVDLRHDSGFLNPGNGEQLNPAAPIYYYSTETDVPEFDQIIRSLSHCQYIVVSLGEDTATLSVAIRIYRLIMQEKLAIDPVYRPPEIYVRIRDDENLKLFPSNADHSVFEHLIQFGSDKEIYSENQVGQSDLELLAAQVRDVYREKHGLLTDDTTTYPYLPEYEKNSNQAAALHIKYKLHFCGNYELIKDPKRSTASENENRQNQNKEIFDQIASEEKQKELAHWEHIRWQAYMRTEGYVHCPFEQTKSIFDFVYKGDPGEAYDKTKATLLEARIHPCIGNEEQHLRNMSMLVSDQKDPDYFYNNDLGFVESIPQIIGDKFNIVPAKRE